MELQLDRLCHYSHRKRATQRHQVAIGLVRSRPLKNLTHTALGANGRVIATELTGLPLVLQQFILKARGAELPGAGHVRET